MLFLTSFYICYILPLSFQIIINRRKGGDIFQPLSFETYVDGSKNGYGKKVTDTPVIDLFEESFGDRPNLQTILGSQQAIDCPSIISS